MAYEVRISDGSSDLCASDLPLPPGQLLRIARDPAMIARQTQHEEQFQVEPAEMPGADLHHQHQAEDPDQKQRRVQDDLEQPPFPVDPLDRQSTSLNSSH